MTDFPPVGVGDRQPTKAHRDEAQRLLALAGQLEPVECAPNTFLNAGSNSDIAFRTLLAVRALAHAVLEVSS